MEEPKYEIDKSDPRNLINMVPRKVRELIERLYTDHPEYLDMHENELYRELRPDRKTEVLRMSFWAEYFRAQDSDNQINITNVFHPHISRERFYTAYLGNQRRLAWILCPSTQLMASHRASLDRGVYEIGEILRMRLFDDAGNLKVAEAHIFLKTYQMVENRVLGASINRTHVISEHKKAEDVEKMVEAAKSQVLEVEKIQE